MKIIYVVYYCTICFAVVVMYWWRAPRICQEMLLLNEEEEMMKNAATSTTQQQQQQQQRDVVSVPNNPKQTKLVVVVVETEQLSVSKHRYDSRMFDIHMTSDYEGPARAFPRWDKGPFPCFPAPRKLMVMQPSKYGLLFLRPHKSGSTTVAGIVMRMAHRRAQLQIRQYLKQTSTTITTTTTTTSAAAAAAERQQQLLQQEEDQLPNGKYLEKLRLQLTPATDFVPAAQKQLYRDNMFCEHRANHGNAVFYQYGARDKTKSFLFSIIRNPTRRSISHFFHFGVAAHRQEPNDVNFQYHLLHLPRNKYLQDLSVYPVDNATNRTVLINNTQVVEDILNEYDFIALLERFDESLVALKMILDLDFEDILYVRERSEGTFSNGDKQRPCIYILPSFLTPGMKSFLKSDEWNDHIEGDVLLYRAVNKSLDLTIDRLGRDEFQRQLTLFQQVNKRAHDKCASRSVGICTVGGQLVPKANRTCYIWSEGCSHACLDEIRVYDRHKKKRPV